MKKSNTVAALAVLALGGCTSFDGIYPISTGAVETPDTDVAVTETKAELVARAGAPLFDGMGSYHREISTTSPAAQKYFDQGMVLAFGFNHAESIRSFQAAQRMDPTCAMCFWGEALATGPNINVTSKGKAVMSEADRVSAFAAINKAMDLRETATAQEQALIEALATRYNGDASTERPPLDTAYAQAMGQFVEAYPEDDDAAAMFAEAWMNTMPWDYWSADGDPKPETVEVIAALERILERKPDHALALHLYIHAVEASSDPGRAEDEADRLANLVPGSGHLVHMPAHIYWRVGRYQDAATANIRAAAVDEEYIAACNAQGFYPALYYPHNIHFLWAAASMSGQSDMAISSARKVAANVHLEQIEQFPTVEFFKTIPLLSLVQFGHWDEILAEPRPPETLDFSNAIWRYARGVALANTGDMDGAMAEQALLSGAKDTVQIQFLDSADYPASVLLNIADALLLGEIAIRSGDPRTAADHFQTAVTLQDGLPYTEPPFWYYPTRQSLGEALLADHRYADAEAVYKHDLKHYPRNGWSMAGLALALDGQDKNAEAAQVRTKLETVWQYADVELTGSRP